MKGNLKFVQSFFESTITKTNESNQYEKRQINSQCYQPLFSHIMIIGKIMCANVSRIWW